MQRSLKKLRPKANKLLSFSANWKRSNRDLNILLGEQLITLYEKETFPAAVELFFEIPAFRRILKNLSNGSLWKDVYVFGEEDHHPPKEIQKVQNIASAFQKICSISHYPNYPENSLAKAKLLTNNIYEYLFIIYKLKSVRGKVSEKIKKQLIVSVKGFIKELKKELRSDKELFAPLTKHESVKRLKSINFAKITKKDLVTPQEILSFLHICSVKKENSSSICHKILNQMHKEIELVFDSIVKNAPFFLPYTLRRLIYENMEEAKDSDELHSSLVALFNDGRYEIIETKQSSHIENVFDACINLHILEKSLDLIATRSDLPEQFKVYYSSQYIHIKDALSMIEDFNSQVGYFLSGFFETQISFLLELLNNPPIDKIEVDLSSIEHKVIAFLETYAKVKPELLQKDIKQAFINDAIKDLELEEAKNYIKNTFSFILPQKNEDTFISLEKQTRKILTSLLKIYKGMDPKSFPALLLKEKIKSLYLIDVPSFSLGWYLFGEIISTLFILESYQKLDTNKTIEEFLLDVYQYPIFSVLLNTKHSNLPKIFIKLQMI
ncbi:MAG: hypothetical protein S4CHLAM20_02320 [Chlamydiia bacterium]|nr:hypothetical protein [Chlamydiia bacterium]